MDDKALEERLTRIEEMLAKLDYRVLRTHEILDVADLKIDLRVRRIEAAIGNFAEVEWLAEKAYIKTHPEAHAEVEAIRDTLDNAAFFETLPTVIDHRRDSKS